MEYYSIKLHLYVIHNIIEIKLYDKNCDFSFKNICSDGYTPVIQILSMLECNFTTVTAGNKF